MKSPPGLWLRVVVAALLLPTTAFSHDADDGAVAVAEEDFGTDNYREFSAPIGERGLFPNIFNLATHADIKASSTCGQSGPTYYCKLVEHVYKRAPQCDICDANDHRHNHPVEYAIDGTPRYWMSPSLAQGLSYEKVNITLDLRQVYQVAYVIVKAGNSPRPGTWVLEKSLDGVVYTPWQFYAINDAECMKVFGAPATRGVPRFKTDDEVLCTSAYSNVDPLYDGEIHTSLVNGRPSAEHYSPELLNFTKARYVRLRLLSLRTLNADLMIVNRRHEAPKLDQSVTRRYFYSIKDISIGGQCICNGHAESCPPDSVNGQFRCECRHNTCGESCSECCALFNQLPWKSGTHDHPNVCQPCQCFNHAADCVYDEAIAAQSLSVTPDGIYEGGGRCIDCQHNTEGVNCEKCKNGFYRPSNVSHYLENACQPCDCDILGSEHGECVRDETVAVEGRRPGDCICKPGFGGRRCEKCAPGYRNYPVCERCPCSQAGSLNFETCEEENCICKANVEGQFCDRCKPGTVFLSPKNPLGCQSCFCFGKSSMCTEGDWSVGRLTASSNWTLTGLHDRSISISPKTNSTELLIFTSADHPENGGQLYYWKAPKPFLGNLLNSYGGDLHYFVYFVPSRESTQPTPVADVMIEGNGMRIMHYTHLNFFPRENMSVTIVVNENSGWYNAQTLQPIDKADLMRVLADVTLFLVRARYTQDQLQSSIYGLTLESAIPAITVSKKSVASDNDTSSQPRFSDIKMNGVEVCECPANFTGNSCERCDSGFRRVNNQLYGGRCEACACEGHSDECDAYTGLCVNCQHNTTGSRCEQCLPGHYGNPLMGGVLGACRPCACPTLANNRSPSCVMSQLVYEGIAAAGKDDYVCTACERGYEGNKCEVCADGYFGDPTAINGTCQPCTCNGNIDSAAIGNCDTLTGECLKCIGNTAGPNCERCDENTWGQALDHTCKACNCHASGSVSLQCHNETGLCECNEHYVGDHCDSCEPGHGDVANGCPECECDDTGSNGPECNAVSGQCSCKTGVSGKRCDRCEASYYNFTDQGCTFCHCDYYGSENKKCNNVTGECECRDNVEGTRCDHCVPGFFNITSNDGCQACECNELGSKSRECNALTGQCLCRDGVTGTKCDKCEANFWGLDENGCKPCQICPAPGQVCNPDNGECVCPPNTIGEKCEACTANAWSYDAYAGCQLCDCNGVGSDSSICDPLNGQCKCKAGFVGHKCDRCEDGYFNFPDCEPCNCNLNGTDPFECRGDACLCTNEGQCKCKQHVTGLKCDTCLEGSFSLDRSNPNGCTTCFCFNRSTTCAQSDLVWQQIYTPDRRILFEDPFVYFDTNTYLNKVGHVLRKEPLNYNSYFYNDLPCYWPLPATFLGDRTKSYNGFLRFKIVNEDNRLQQHGIRPHDQLFKIFPQVVLIGNDRIILEHTAQEITDDNRYRVRLHESKWKNRITPQLPVTRAQLMTALQNVQGVYVRGSYNTINRGDAITLRDVSLDVAVEPTDRTEDSIPAIGVEQCSSCEIGYGGGSCQDPAESYCRKHKPNYLDSTNDFDLIGFATPCACNGHSKICDPETCRCKECQHNTLGDFCHACKEGYHGDPSDGSPESCVKCACPLSSNSFSDTCQPADTGRGYVCDGCKAGYAGLYCETCLTGYFGNPNIEGGYCQPCVCHPFGSLTSTCNNVTGQCDCREGVEGRDCSKCSPRHAFINGICTSCDQGCYKVLMQLQDDMEDQLAEVKSLSDDTPKLPRKRLRKINEAVDSYQEIMAAIKDSEKAANDLIGPDSGENKHLREANHVIEEGKVLEEKANETLAKIRGIQANLSSIQENGRESQRKIMDHVGELTHFVQKIQFQHKQGSLENIVLEVEGKLEDLKKRDKVIEKQVNFANQSKQEAEKLLKEVLSKKLNDTNYDILFEKLEDHKRTIRDFRDAIWDHARVNASAAKSITGLVNKRLEELRGLVAEISKVGTEQSEALALTTEAIDSVKQKLLDTNDAYEEIKNLLKGLKASSDKTKEKSDAMVAALRKDRHEIIKAEQHVREIVHDAKKLEGKLKSAEDFSTDAVAATNSYRDIVDALSNATQAAAKARESAEEAYNDIGDDSDIESSLVAITNQVLNDSQAIWDEIDDSEEPEIEDSIERLRAIVNKIQKATADANNSITAVKNAQDVLDDHTERIDNVETTVDRARAVVDNKTQSIDKLAKDIDELKIRADGVSGFTADMINEDIANVTSATDTINNSVEKLKDIKVRGQLHAVELQNVRQTLAVLKEKLAEAKEKANSLRISLRSEPQTSCARSYVSPAHPSPTNAINLKYRPVIDVPDSLLFLTLTKARRTQPREFLAISLEERRIVVRWNIGTGTRRATNSHSITYIPASDRYTWYHIDVVRIGNSVKVSVALKQTLTGEGPKNVGEPVEVRVGEPDSSSDVVLNTVPGETLIHIGHEDSDLTTEIGLRTNHFTGVLGELTIDGDNVPLWVFNEQTGQCEGAVAAPAPVTRGQFFRNGFAQVRMPMTERVNNQIRIVYSSYSSDGLLYFRGNAGTKEFVAIELRSGAVWVKARYGEGSYVEVHSGGNKYADGATHTIKVTRNQAEIDLQMDGSDDDRVAVTIPGDNNALNIADDDPHFVGGVPLDFNRSPFAGRDISWNGFVGCIQLVKPTQVNELDLAHPERSQRTHPGCEFKDDKLLPGNKVIGFAKPGYVVTKAIPIDTNTTLSFNVRTKNNNAVLLYQKLLKRGGTKRAAATEEDEKTFFAFYIYNGRLIVHLGTDHIDRLKRPSLSSNQSYNDGRLHSIFFSRIGSNIEVRIDDAEVAHGELQDETIIGSPSAKLYLGGLPDKLKPRNDNNDMGTTEPLIGCLSDFYVNYERWSVIPEEHQSQLGTCVHDDEITHETEEKEDAGFERKTSKLTLQLAAPTYDIGNSDGIPVKHKNLIVSNLDAGSCRAVSAPAPETWAKAGARYGATETSHSRINFDKPYPDFKKFHLAFLIKTSKPNGLVWAWANYKNFTRYFYLYVEDGFLTLEVKGHKQAKKLHYREKRIDDGAWHAVDLARDDRAAVLQVDNLLPAKLLDVPFPKVLRKRMYVGGLISKHKKMFNFTHSSFDGCIRDFIVDDIVRELHNASRDLVPCTEARNTAYIHEGGFVTFDALKSFSPSFDGTNAIIDVTAKVRAENATGVVLALISMSDHLSTRVVVDLTGDSLRFSAVHAATSTAIDQAVALPPATTCPGEWHRVHVTLTYTTLILSMDDTKKSFPIEPAVPAAAVEAFRNQPLFIGGVNANLANTRNLTSLSSCIQDINVSGRPVPIEKAKRLHKVLPDSCPFN